MKFDITLDTIVSRYQKLLAIIEAGTPGEKFPEKLSDLFRHPNFEVRKAAVEYDWLMNRRIGDDNSRLLLDVLDAKDKDDPWLFPLGAALESYLRNKLKKLTN
jgi:hypothetical protein